MARWGLKLLFLSFIEVVCPKEGGLQELSADHRLAGFKVHHILGGDSHHAVLSSVKVGLRLWSLSINYVFNGNHLRL